MKLKVRRKKLLEDYIEAVAKVNEETFKLRTLDQNHPLYLTQLRLRYNVIDKAQARVKSLEKYITY